MKNILENIYKISNDANLFYIECNNITIQSPIIDGTVKIQIVDDENYDIGINGLEINDSIKIYYKEKKNNMIIPIKIIKLNNYSFNSMSSSSDNEYILN
jgi:hypothetical protein